MIRFLDGRFGGTQRPPRDSGLGADILKILEDSPKMSAEAVSSYC